MLVKALLWNYKKADGTQLIRIYAKRGGDNIYIGMKLSVLEKDWDSRTGFVRTSHPNCDLINAKITTARNSLEAVLLKYPKANADTILNIYNSGYSEKITLLQFAKKFIEDCEKGKPIRTKGTIKGYWSTLRTLEKFNKEKHSLDFDTININTYERLLSFVREKGLLESSVGNKIKFLKLILNEAHSRGIYKELEHRKKYFKNPHKLNDNIYLNKDEIDKIISVDLSERPDLLMERDRFLVSYFLILRYSDSVAIKEGNFFEKDGKFFFQTKNIKTSTNVVVPVKPIVFDILKKYDFNIDGDTNQEANRKLKVIGKLAKIEDKIFLNGELNFKWQLITTHTARRSGATNLYLDKVPEKIIMDMGGWKKVEVFRRYIRVDKLESAMIASDYDFFK